MALPVLTTPVFNTIVPSTGQKIEFRPFLVKEEKLLLIALESGDAMEIVAATKRILESCILTDIKLDKLATFDVEYLFLQLRGKSVGEVVEIVVGHTGDTECTARTPVSINLDDIKVEGVTKDHKIMITDDIGVVVRYPSMDDVAGINGDDPESTFNIIAQCVDTVFDAENVYDEFTVEEVRAWLDGLSQTQFKKVADFFTNLPQLRHKVEWTCKECKQKDSFMVEGLQSFFTLL